MPIFKEPGLEVTLLAAVRVLRARENMVVVSYSIGMKKQSSILQSGYWMLPLFNFFVLRLHPSSVDHHGDPMLKVCCLVSSVCYLRSILFRFEFGWRGAKVSNVPPILTLSSAVPSAQLLEIIGVCAASKQPGIANAEVGVRHSSVARLDKLLDM